MNLEVIPSEKYKINHTTYHKLKKIYDSNKLNESLTILS
jgi:hypothetical protein